MKNGRRKCWLGSAGSAVTGFLFGFGIGLPAAKEIGSFALAGRIWIAAAFGVVGAVAGFLVGLAQFCTGDENDRPAGEERPMYFPGP